jgi:uncharacterized protein
VFRGAGTVLNVLTVLAGSGLGLLVGARLPARTRDVVTDALGLVTLLVAALSAAAVLDPALQREVGTGAPLLVVLGALLLGGVAGSLLHLEARLERLGGVLQARLLRGRAAGGRAAGGRAAGEQAAGERAAAGRSLTDGGPDSATTDFPVYPPEQRERFVQGFLTASLVFCVGPLTVLGALSDGLGLGIEQLALKSTLDGFAALAFAASLGVGVAASALTVAVVQGSFTVVGVVLGGVLTPGAVSALTATGGLLLVGVALRLLRVRQVPVADLLPALVLAPLLVEAVSRVR